MLSVFEELFPPASSMPPSCFTGNVVNGTIGKQMVDMLVESSNNVEMILKFFDMFLKLKDLTSSDTFKEYDPDGKGKATDTSLFFVPVVKFTFLT